MSALRNFWVTVVGVDEPKLLNGNGHMPGGPTSQTPAPVLRSSTPSPAPAAPNSQPASTPVPSIKISPETASILAGGQQQFTATDLYSDQDWTSKVDWRASPADVISIDDSGLATGKAEVYSPTTATITATDRDGGFTASITVTVDPGPQPDTFGPKVKKFDLWPLRVDLKSAIEPVATALQAEKAMRNFAASAGVDLDKPDTAVTCMKSKMTEQDKTNLKNSANISEQGRLQMVRILQHMQDTTSQLEAAKQRILPDKLPRALFDDLQKTVGNASKVVAFLWGLANKVSALIDPTSRVNAVPGADAIKDKIKSFGDQAKGHTKELVQVGQKINELIGALDDATKQEMSNLNVSLQKDADAFTTATEDYFKNLGTYAEVLGNLSSRAGCPPEYSKTYVAVVAAAQMSKTARAALITKTLAPDKYKTFLNQLVPLGKLVANLPATERSLTGNLIVYEKGGTQYGYNATSATLESLVQQLKLVKKVYDSAPSIEQISKEWNSALTN